jgi:adenylosuccinate lyase
MATENVLMSATVRGGDRQELHERLRGYSLAAHEAVERGEENPLVERILADGDFGLDRAELEGMLDPAAYTGRSAPQVDEFLASIVRPALQGIDSLEVEEPRV